MGYNFYGAEHTNIKAVNKIYEGIETPHDLYDALRKTWCRETCSPRMRENWYEENMTMGQCSITALLVQDIFGGDVYEMNLSDGAVHCYNVIGDFCLDLTSEQFGDKKDLCYEGNPKQNREMRLADEDKRARYELLKEKLKKNIL